MNPEAKLKVAMLSLVKDRSVYLLGNVTLATYIREKCGVDVRIIDTNWEDVLDSVKEYSPDVVCLSTVSVGYPETIEIAGKIKELLPDTITMIGGLHISTFPKSLKKCFDLGVIGEAEETFEELVRLFIKERGLPRTDALQKVKGVAFFGSDGKLVITEKRELMDSLDCVPIPDLSLVDRRYFKRRDLHTFKGKPGIQASIVASRGCPFKCGFCASPVFWEGRIRSFSVPRIVQEIKEYHEKYGVDYIQAYDDIFPISKQKTRELIEELEKQGLLGKVKFAVQMRAHMVDEEFYQLLKKLGVETISFGFESGSERMLKLMKSGPTSLEFNRRAAVLGRKYGLNIYGSFIIGNPEEKMEDIDKTFEFIKELKEIGMDGIDCFICSPFPGTAFWDYAVKNGRIDPKNYETKPPDFYSPDNAYVVDKSISKEDLIKKHREITDFLSAYSQRRSIKSILLYPKEPRTRTVAKAIKNPREAVRRVVHHLS